MRRFFFVPLLGAMLSLFSFLLLLSGPSALAQNKIPDLWGQRVHDETKSLSASTIDLLEKQLAAYEDSTTNQIAILMIAKLNGEPIEDYSLKVAEKWRLGTKKSDNGTLLVVAVDDHAMRIEVGKGLEGVLTDAVSSEIIRNELAPNFRRGNYDAGVKEAVNAIIQAIGGEYKSSDIAASSSSEDSLLSRIIVGFFVFGLLGTFTFIALFSTGCSGWGAYAFLIPFYAFFTWTSIGVLAAKILFGTYLIGFPIAKIVIGRTKWGKGQIEAWKKNTPTSGGRSSGGWLGGGSFLSGGGGGGFMGGGGGFGGGGASGSW